MTILPFGRRPLAAVATLLALGLTACVGSGGESGVDTPRLYSTTDRIANRLGVGSGEFTFEGRLIDILTADGVLRNLDLALAEREAQQVTRANYKKRIGTPRLAFDGAKSPTQNYFPFIKSGPAIRRLEQMRDALLAHWPGKKPNVRIVIGATQELGGTSLPNEITMNLGSLVPDNKGNPATPQKIASILAHELSHVLLDHHRRDEFVQREKILAGAIAGTAIAGAQLAQTRARRSENGLELYDGNPKKAKTARNWALAGVIANTVVVEGLIGGTWQRELEEQADVLGLDLVYRAGMDDSGAFDALEQLAQFEATKKTRLEQHDAESQRRVAEAEKKAQETQNPAVMFELGPSIMIGASSAALGDIWDWVAGQHPTPARREETMTNYLDLRYTDFTTDVTPARVFTSPFPGNSLVSFHKGVVAADAAAEALTHNDLASAKKHIRAARKTRLKNHPKLRLVEADVEKHAGNNKKAIQILERIQRDYDTPYRVYSELAGLYIGANRISRANLVINQGKEIYGERNFLNHMISLAFSQGDYKAADRHYLRCRGMRDEKGYEKIAESCHTTYRSDAQAAGRNTEPPKDPNGGLLQNLFSGI